MSLKVKKVEAFRSEDGCIWKTEKDTIENNIENFIPCLNSDNYSINKNRLLEWFRNEKHQVRYVLANIDKIMDKREDE